MATTFAPRSARDWGREPWPTAAMSSSRRAARRRFATAFDAKTRAWLAARRCSAQRLLHHPAQPRGEGRRVLDARALHQPRFVEHQPGRVLDQRLHLALFEAHGKRLG